MIYYNLSCKWGRLPVDAATEAEAVMMGVRYAACNGVRVRVVAETQAEERIVATIPPTWVTATVIHLVLGHAIMDVPAESN